MPGSSFAQTPAAAVAASGGLLAYLSAARAGVDCAVSNYGVGIEKRLDEAATAKCPMVFHMGALDKFTPPEVVEAIRGGFKGRSDVEIYVYPGADHGFARKGGDHYDKPAAMMAHTRSMWRSCPSTGLSLQPPQCPRWPRSSSRHSRPILPPE